MDDEEAGVGGAPRQARQWKSGVSLLAFQSLGLVYGDLSTSPLYVYRSAASAFAVTLGGHEATVFGFSSLVFWTLTLVPLLKYALIVLSADDNGEGGTFALYSLLCRHAKFSLLPDQQPADEELSTYYQAAPEAGAAGLQAGWVVFISCVVLVGLFALQHRGTHKVAFMFAPIVMIWLLSVGIIGLYNIVHWNPRIVLSLSPHYIVKFFKIIGRDGWMDLGGVLLAITGTEAMFADLGHFNAASIRVAFVGVIYPFLVLQYMGQAAFLSKNMSAVHASFYRSVPRPVFWPMFVMATLAAVVGSQAIISATFSTVKQCLALGCFPRVKVVHTSKWIYCQIYIPEINWILLVLCLVVTVAFRDITAIGNAYGLACITVMFVTTCLMSLVILFVWQKNLLIATLFLVVFGSVEAVYLSAAAMKVPHGGWAPIVFALAVVLVMYVWHYGTRRKYLSDLQNKVPARWILVALGGGGLAVERVPGIGVVYTELATGVPALFSRFVTNLPAFHRVLVFACVKAVPVPHVPAGERCLVGRVGPPEHRMYRCVVRYGYMDDVRKDDDDLESLLVMSIAKFIQLQAAAAGGGRSNEELSSSSSTELERMPVVVHATADDRLTAGTGLIAMREYPNDDDEARAADVVGTSPPPQRDNEQGERSSRRRRVRFRICEEERMDPRVREELSDLVAAKEAGVAYIVGNSYVKARKNSSLLKRLAVPPEELQGPVGDAAYPPYQPH